MYLQKNFLYKYIIFLVLLLVVKKTVEKP